MNENKILNQLATMIAQASISDYESVKRAIDYYRSHRRYITASQDVFDILKTLKKVELEDMFLKKKKVQVGNTIRSRLNGRTGKVINVNKDGFTIEVKWDEGGSQILPVELVYVLTKKEKENFTFPLGFERPLDEGDVNYEDIGKTPSIFKKKQASVSGCYRVLPYNDFVTYITRIASKQNSRITKDDLITMLCAFYDLPEIAIKQAYFAIESVSTASLDSNSYKYVSPEVCLFEDKKECLGDIFVGNTKEGRVYISII